MAKRSGKGSKDDTKGKTLGLRPAKNNFVWGLSESYIENLSQHILNEQQLERLQIEHQRQQARYKEHEKDVDLVRFAFLLLKKELGVAELDKINPLLVHAFSRAALTDGLDSNNGQRVYKYAKAVLNHEALAVKPPMPAFNKMLAENQHLLAQSRNMLQMQRTKNNNSKQTYLFKIFNKRLDMNENINNKNFFIKQEIPQDNVRSPETKKSPLNNPFPTKPSPPT